MRVKVLMYQGKPVELNKLHETYEEREVPYLYPMWATITQIKSALQVYGVPAPALHRLGKCELVEMDLVDIEPAPTFHML